MILRKRSVRMSPVGSHSGGVTNERCISTNEANTGRVLYRLRIEP